MVQFARKVRVCSPSMPSAPRNSREVPVEDALQSIASDLLCGDASARERAWAELVDLTQQRLRYNLLGHGVAEQDVSGCLSDVHFGLLRHLRRNPVPRDLLGWLFVTSRNVARNWVRADGRRNRRFTALDDVHPHLDREHAVLARYVSPLDASLEIAFTSERAARSFFLLDDESRNYVVGIALSLGNDELASLMGVENTDAFRKRKSRAWERFASMLTRDKG